MGCMFVVFTFLFPRLGFLMVLGEFDRSSTKVFRHRETNSPWQGEAVARSSRQGSKVDGHLGCRLSSPEATVGGPYQRAICRSPTPITSG